MVAFHWLANLLFQDHKTRQFLKKSLYHFLQMVSTQNKQENRWGHELPTQHSKIWKLKTRSLWGKTLIRRLIFCHKKQQMLKWSNSTRLPVLNYLSRFNWVLTKLMNKVQPTPWEDLLKVVLVEVLDKKSLQLKIKGWNREVPKIPSLMIYNTQKGILRSLNRY